MSHDVRCSGLCFSRGGTSRWRQGNRISRPRSPAVRLAHRGNTETQCPAQGLGQRNRFVSLCGELESGLPDQCQQALKSHLLIRLFAIGLQVDPREKFLPQLLRPNVWGTAEWTVPGNAPGRFSAVLLLESTDDQPNRPVVVPPKPRWDFDLERPARLHIQFQDPWTDPSRGVGARFPLASAPSWSSPRSC